LTCLYVMNKLSFLNWLLYTNLGGLASAGFW
jgi:hypothetical protein